MHPHSASTTGVNVLMARHRVRDTRLIDKVAASRRLSFISGGWSRRRGSLAARCPDIPPFNAIEYYPRVPHVSELFADARIDRVADLRKELAQSPADSQLGIRAVKYFLQLVV